MRGGRLPILAGVALIGAAALAGVPAPSSAATGDPGAVWAWGYNDARELADGTRTNRYAPVASNVGAMTAVTGGEYFTLALDPVGVPWAWGNNTFRQLGRTDALAFNPARVGGLASLHTDEIAAGGYHGLALIENGDVRTWGRNDSGQLGDGTTTVRASATPVPGLTGVAAIAGGGFHSLAARSNGAVYAWGRNTAGQLGDGTITNRLSPVPVPGVSGAVSVAGGFEFSTALTATGEVYTWGRNNFGQLGNGTLINSTTPVLVPGLPAIAEITAGYDHMIARAADGRLFAWGRNNSGQLGDGTTMNRPSPVIATAVPSGVVALARGAWDHSIALAADGSVWAWGTDALGQLGNGLPGANSSVPVRVSGLVNAVAVGGGGHHSLAIEAPPAPIILTPTEGQLTNARPLQVSGTGRPNTTLTLYESSAVIATTTVNGSGGWSANVSFADGAHTIAAQDEDSFGVPSRTSAPRAFTVDTVPPDTTIVSGPPAVTSSTAATFDLAATEPGSTFECSLDGAAPASCTASVTLTGLADGTHTFRARATDPAGNTDLTPAEHTWTVDTSGPDVAITRPVQGIYVADALEVPAPLGAIVVGPVTVRASVADAQTGISAVTFSVDGTTVDPALVTYDSEIGVASFLYEPDYAGEHEIVAGATNGVSLTGSSSVTVLAVPLPAS